MLFLIILLLVVALSASYIALSIYLIRKEKIEGIYYNSRHEEIFPVKYPTMDAVREHEKILADDPNNIELRIEILTVRLFHHRTYDQDSMNHALWFIKNVPLHSFTRHTNVTVNDDEMKRKVLDIWTQHIEKSNRSPQYLQAAANQIALFDKESAIKYLNELLSICPFSKECLQDLARIDEWKLPRGIKTTHPVPELKESIEYWTKYFSVPWSRWASSKVERIRWRHPIAFPIWYCYFLLWVISKFDKDESSWNSYYEVSHYGLSAYLYGDYDLAKKCATQFLKLQPAAEKGHNHQPLYADGFNLAAMLALRENNLSDLGRYLEKKAQDPANSEFSFLFDDTEILTELARYNRADIALDYIQKRTRGTIPDEGTQELIDYIKGGGIPFSEEHYLHKEALYNKRKESKS
jgi:hypothetical protein